MSDREQRENEHFIGRFDEIADAVSHECHRPAVNDAYRLMFAQRDRMEQMQAERAEDSGRRILSAIGVAREQDCPQPFGLYRHQDVTGVSGAGTVAYGVQFMDGTVVIRWLGEDPSTVVWGSLEAAMRVHGHDGRTQVVWLLAPFSEMGLAEQEAATEERARIRRGILGIETILERPETGESVVAVETMALEALIGPEDGSEATP